MLVSCKFTRIDFRVDVKLKVRKLRKLVVELEDCEVFNNKLFVEYKGGYINRYMFKRDNDGYYRGLDYIFTM